MPPTSPRKIGTGKLRISIDSSSCAAMTASAPTAPRKRYSASTGGGQPGRRAISRPHTAYSKNTNAWVSSASFATTKNFAKYKSRGGTGAAMMRFQLCPICSSRHRYAA